MRQLHSSKLALWLGLLLALPVLGGPLGDRPAEAQEETGGEAEDDGLYFESVDVNVVNVDVWVTDKNGEPITGLTRDDFEIYEDGRPVPISNFTAFEYSESELSVNAEAAREKALAEGLPLPPELATLGLSEDQRLHLVVYVDNFNIRPFNRNRVFRRLREFLAEKLRDGDRVMLVSYDRSLHIRHPFTTDTQLINSGLFELEEVSGHAVHYDSERRDLLREIEESDSYSEVAYRIKTFASSRFNDLSFSLDAMTEIVDSLAGLKGRKALLYVSDGLPMTPAEDLFYAVHQKFQESSVLTIARDFDAHRRYRTLASKANSNGVTFYAIDAAGLRASTTASVQMETANTPGVMNFVDSVYTSNLQQPLMMMAEITGGQVIYNANDVGPGLDRIARDFESYYSLGYTPSHAGTGRYYKVEVKLADKRKGVRIRHREGYRDKPVYDRMTDGTISSLRYGYEDNPWGLVLRLGQGQPTDKNQFDVPVLVGIPLGKVVTVPRDGYHEARLKLYFGAMDDDGEFSDVQEVKLPLKIAADEFDPEKYYPVQDLVRMKSGGHRLAVGVWDEIGSEGSFVTKGLIVGGPTGASQSLREN